MLIFSEWKKLEKSFVDDEEAISTDLNGLIEVMKIKYFCFDLFHSFSRTSRLRSWTAWLRAEPGPGL